MLGANHQIKLFKLKNRKSALFESRKQSKGEQDLNLKQVKEKKDIIAKANNIRKLEGDVCLVRDS